MSKIVGTDVYKILRNEKVGRYVVAGRSLQPGDLILAEAAFVFGPKTDTPPVCLGCYSPVDTSVLCSKCGWPVCGAECEETQAHRQAECKEFVACGVKFTPVEDPTSPCPQYDCITPLRCLVAKETNSSRWEAEVQYMEPHNAARKEKPIWEVNQVNVVNFLRNHCKINRFEEDLIHTICGILEVNCFEGRSSSGYAVRALYPKLAMMSHNCVSNTTHSIEPLTEDGESFRVSLRVTIPIAEGQELFACYTHSLSPTLLRRQHLREGKFFDCDCPRCSDPTELGTHMSSLKCNKCDPGLIVSTNPLDPSAAWKCSHCDFSTRGEAVQKVFAAIQTEIDVIEETAQDANGIEKRESIFRKYRSVLHPKHAFMTCLRHSLSQMYGRIDGYLLDDLPDVLLERKMELCKQFLEVIEVVEPGQSRLRGMTIYELHAPLLLLARNQYRSDTISKDMLRKKIEEVISLLEEAALILTREPPALPEGIIGQVAQQSLLQLKENIDSLVEAY